MGTADVTELPEAEEREAVTSGLPIPWGRRVVLPGRGTTFVREVAGPPGAPAVLLLHGWMASGALNWFAAFPALGERYRVLAIDHRGHGRGIRSRSRFRLADCADDAAALLDQLGVERAIAVGYSLGGPVAQLLWKRHPDKVAGLVLGATSHRLMPGAREAMIFSTMMSAAAGTTRMGQLAARGPVRGLQRAFAPKDVASHGVRPETMRAWARAEMQRHDARMVMEAGVAMSNYNGSFVATVDVPTTVLVTAKDRAINPYSQLRMALKIPGAQIHRIDDGHIACAKPAFGTAVRHAVDSVAQRL